MAQNDVFRANIRKLLPLVRKELLPLLVKQIVISTAKRIVEGTPVGNPDLWSRPAPDGYVGGRLKSNWQYGAGSINTETGSVIGSDSLARISAGLEDFEIGTTIYITNSLPYARRVEYGWSTQAPQGMVRLAIEDFNKNVMNAVREANK